MAKKKITKRTEIINAAIRLFSRFSFQEISISSIAREAGCGHSLVYHYFSNVNEIYDAAFNEVQQSVSPFFANIKSSSLAPELTFVGIITKFVEALKADLNLAFYTQFIISALGPKSREIKKIQKEWRNSLRTLIIKGQETNRFIQTLPLNEFLDALNYSISGLISSLIFANVKRSSVSASQVYLLFLKGGQ